MHRLRPTHAILAALLLVGCATEVREPSPAALRAALSTAVETRAAAADGDDPLAAFYRQRQLQPLWVGPQGSSAAAGELAALLAAADRDGMDPEDYGAGRIGTLREETGVVALAELELALSGGLVAMARDLDGGRIDPLGLPEGHYPARERVEPATVLTAAAEGTRPRAIFAAHRPPGPAYRRLKRALARYRALQTAGGWPAIAVGPMLRPGMRDPRADGIRHRLRLWGDLADDRSAQTQDGAGDLYDARLAAAMRRMQRRHGLKPDGIVGPRTLAALNVPVERRIEQILVNLERRRWMGDALGERHILVNLADFQLKLVEDEATRHVARVVIGDAYHRTPVFSERMTHMVLNPEWNVPPRIAAEEMLPALKRDPGYLAAHGFTLLSDWSDAAVPLAAEDIDWSRVEADSFPYRLRQEPGPGNALGRIKFMLPNRFSIYLHDTPRRELFDRQRRAFSHGCIRVERPLELAALLLSGQAEGSPQHLQAILDSGRRVALPLERPMPVHITYLTAWGNADGTVHFRDDVYDRDAAVASALRGGPRIARHRGGGGCA